MNYKKLLYSALCTSVFFAMPLCAQDEEQEIDQEETVVNGFNPARTSHEGSNHKYVGRTQYYDLIKLEDGSYWSVNPDHQELLQNWFEGDPIAIRQASRKWWGNNDLYPFVIYNRRTDENIEVKFATEPEYHNFYRRYINEISKSENNAFIVLNDNTLWPLKEKERDIWSSWIPGDVIIIGSNNTYLSWLNPNILINTNCGATVVVSKKKN